MRHVNDQFRADVERQLMAEIRLDYWLSIGCALALGVLVGQWL